MTKAPTPPGLELDRDHRRRRRYMVAFWVLVFGSAAQTWQIATNEFTSIFVSLLMLPFLLRACDRWSLHTDT